MPEYRRKIVVLIVAAVAVCHTAGYVSAQNPTVLTVPAVVLDDFQGDSLGQWASYPPAQDIGYEPSLTPTSDFEAPGGRALMRWVHPTRTDDLRFGFIKKVNLISKGDARIAFEYRINSPSERVRIEIGVAGGDGHRYLKTMDAAPNLWSRLSVSLSELRRADNEPLGPGTGMEAVFLVAHLGNANKDSTYRFLIDNVEISAAKNASFTFQVPRSLGVEPWLQNIALPGYRAEDVLRIEAHSPVSLSRASGVVRNNEGRMVANTRLYDDGTHGDAKANDDIWTHQAVYGFTRSDRPGSWRIELNGETHDGKSISAELRFLVRPHTVSSHPRLYFGSGDKAKLTARMRAPKLAKVWEYIQTGAKNSRASGEIAHGGRVFELLDTEYLLPSLLGYFDVLNRARSRIAYNAFVAYLTDDAEVRAAAKEALLAVSRWSRWEPPWFTAHGQHTYYPAGLLAVDVALGYDLLYDHLSEPERLLVRRAVIERSIVPTYKEYFLDNRAMADTSNWISHTVGGALIAASAIAGDITAEETDGNFDLYVGGLLMKVEAHMAASYLPDGSYGEGISYQEFDMETLAPMMYAVERTFGIDYWQTTHVKDSLRYAVYTLTYPREASLDMGDTHPPAGFGISPMIYRSRDPVLRWYFSRFDRPSLQHFIFYDDSVEPQSPITAGLPTSAIFKDKGNAVFRTGWGEDSITMLFRAGPNFNHHHADQGSFLITAFGEPLVTEAGWSDYYKDPYYSTFFTQAVGHNTMLVDGDTESQTIPDSTQFKALDSYPRITDALTSDFFDAVASELVSVYKGRLDRYVRRIVFIKPDYFVVFDDIKAKKPMATFDFLLHMPHRDRIESERDMTIYNGTKASLAVRSFAPEAAVATVTNGRIPYPALAVRTPADTPPQPAYVDIRATAHAGEAQFLTVLVPAKSAEAARGLAASMTAIKGSGWIGIRTAHNSETDRVMFSIGGRTTTISHDQWRSEASSVAVAENGNAVRMFAVQNGRSLDRDNKVYFSSESPVSIAANYAAAQTEAVVNAGNATAITLYTVASPGRVLLDDEELSASAFQFDAATGLLRITIPAGQHRIVVRKM